ncbi:putative riboflavin kinase [Phaeomoniella chlamydospora]|uniref:Riboflavin kinase n=1 Tax=Phaeomoniella chlamydospora TaxID=158046 RepID=A0A0G2E6Y1_PHACM|nr:putative riboflavin kinase [Phaeomoniella chlamydospora]
MPLEIGLKVASTIANNAAANAIQPVTGVVQEHITQYQPGTVIQDASLAAYDAAGISKKVDQVGERFDQARDALYDPILDTDVANLELQMVGDDIGPAKPYPIRFDGKVVRGRGKSQTEFGLPTANLSGVADDHLLRLSGVYFGWASVIPKDGTDVDADWHEAIITIGPSQYAAPSIVVKKVVLVHIISDFGSATFFGSKVKVIVMGFLHPMSPGDVPTLDRGQILYDKYQDIAIAEASLSRPHWGPEMTIERIKTEKSQRSFSEKYVDARSYTQKQFDKIPMHRAGIRGPGAELKDRALGNGGLWFPR